MANTGHTRHRTMATLDTQDTGRWQTKQNKTQHNTKTKMISSTDPVKKPGANTDVREGKQ